MQLNKDMWKIIIRKTIYSLLSTFRDNQSSLLCDLSAGCYTWNNPCDSILSEHAFAIARTAMSHNKTQIPKLEAYIDSELKVLSRSHLSLWEGEGKIIAINLGSWESCALPQIFKESSTADMIQSFSLGGGLGERTNNFSQKTEPAYYNVLHTGSGSL
jgi:hypothetical protein